MFLGLPTPEKNNPIINIFGLSLYLDDIIILGVLYLLYTEKNDDTMLYLCLIYLLLN